MIYTTEGTILEHTRLAPDTWQVIVHCPEISATVKPGQFVMAAVDSSEELPSPILKRALAVYQAEHEHLGLLVRIKGEGTRKICRAAPGNNLSLVGPLGNGFNLERGRGRFTIIAVGGSGIASVYLLARDLFQRGEELCLLYGGKSSEDLAGIDDFRSLGIPVHTSTEDGSLGYHGLLSGALRKLITEMKGKDLNIYTCGPNPMMQAVCDLARRESIPCQISVEIKMACGFGVCLGCAVRTVQGNRLACTHGPIFDGLEFIWEDFKGGRDSGND